MQINHYIKKLIEQGEGLHLDFKFEISDAKKIAHTFSAFANTEGGKLLIGVKDNGKIAGIRSDEEYYMLETAAHIFCKPAVTFSCKVWNLDGKTILEVSIPESIKKPHLSIYKNDKWLAWIRVGDQNILANDVMMKVWQKKKNKAKGICIKYSKKETTLLDYLKENPKITINKFCKLTKIGSKEAKEILSDLILIDLVEILFTDKQVYYRLNPLNKMN